MVFHQTPVYLLLLLLVAQRCTSPREAGSRDCEWWPDVEVVESSQRWTDSDRTWSLWLGVVLWLPSFVRCLNCLLSFMLDFWLFAIEKVKSMWCVSVDLWMYADFCDHIYLNMQIYQVTRNTFYQTRYLSREAVPIPTCHYPWQNSMHNVMLKSASTICFIA